MAMKIDAVAPGSDAAALGLAPGDELLAVDGNVLNDAPDSPVYHDSPGVPPPARGDAHRLARLRLRRGDWNGRRLVSEAYMDELMRPASYLKDQWGKDTLSYYGFQTWIMDYHGMRCPYLRGMLGQYVIAIPDLDAIVVRLGRKRCDVYNREITTDITRYMDIAIKILKES